MLNVSDPTPAAELLPMTEIAVDAGTFPTDGYIATSVAELTGLALRPPARARPPRPAR